MKKILKYFRPAGKLTHFEVLKSNALIVFNILAILNNTILILYFLIHKPKNLTTLLFGLTLFAVSAFILLFLLKKIGVKKTGNILSIIFSLIIALLLQMHDVENSIYIKFTQTFYITYTVLIINGLFASKKVLIINSIIILLASTKLYLFGIEYYPTEEKLLKASFSIYVGTMILSVVILYFMNLFAEMAIQSANKDAVIKSKQYNSIKKLLDHIKTSSSQLFESGLQLTKLATEMSENASIQAASTEEIASTISEMHATVVNKTESASFAGNSTKKALDEIKNSNAVFLKTIESVSEISERINFISEIANKTDILSINAAIEAARSKNDGKGFAVIASEIRKLADKTKNASIDINKLSNQGKDVSLLAKSKLDLLIPEIIKSVEMVNEIVNSGGDIVQSIEITDKAIIELSNITNNNSASAEELASSAEELSGQAEMLKSILDNNKIE